MRFNLIPARLKFEHYKELVKINAVSQQDYDDASAALKQIEADVEAGKAAVETARINLAYTKVTAPVSGRIGRFAVTDGAVTQPAVSARHNPAVEHYVHGCHSVERRTPPSDAESVKRSGKMTKKKILDVASRIFSEYGNVGASMRMIAGGANTSVSTLYLYFKNKEDLYLTVMKAEMDEFSDKIMGSIKDIADPSEAIRAFIKMSLKYAKKHPALILLLQGRERRFVFDLKIKREFFKKQRTFIEDIIRNGIQSGSFQDVNIRETAQIILSMIIGSYLSASEDPSPLFSSEQCSELILHGLIRRDKK